MHFAHTFDSFEYLIFWCRQLRPWIKIIIMTNHFDCTPVYLLTNRLPFILLHQQLVEQYPIIQDSQLNIGRDK